MTALIPPVPRKRGRRGEHVIAAARRQALCVPLAEWPLADRIAWERAVRAAPSPLDASGSLHHLKASTRRGLAWA